MHPTKETTVRPILLIQAGTPPDEIRQANGDLPIWFCNALELPTETVEVVRVFEGEPLPPPHRGRVAVITGSWSMVTERLPWSEAAAQWIRDAMAVDMPLFGVCYGHQLMSHALGGRVDFHPEGREIGYREIRMSPAAATDPLLKDMPLRFNAHLTHMQTVLELPTSAVALAASEHDPHQVVRYGPRAISTQFHPEFTPEISSAIIRFRTDALRQEGLDPDGLLDDVQDAPFATRLLARFVKDALGEDRAAASIQRAS
ncbi:glutamine amidotransferase [Rhizobium sp. LEGMi198b]